LLCLSKGICGTLHQCELFEERGPASAGLRRFRPGGFEGSVMNRFKLKRLACLSASLPLFLLIVLASCANAGTGTGRLGDPCAVNSDCGEELYCAGAPRVCGPPRPGFPDQGMNREPTGKQIPPCQSDSDCPRGFTCSTARNDRGLGLCGAGETACKSDLDCASSFRCTKLPGETGSACLPVIPH
jgi:Cys-rich repeat protein